MRAVPFSDSGTSLAALVTIVYGTQTLRFTTWNEAIIIDGNSWEPGPGAAITNIQTPSDGSPATADVSIMAVTGGLVEPGDGIRGVFDGWPVTIELVDPDDTDAGTLDMIPNATIGTVSEDTRGVAIISVNGPLSLTKNPLTEHFSLTGREDLGDDRCKIPIIPDDIARDTLFITADQPAPGLQAVNDAYGRVRTGVAGTVEDYANVYFECTTEGTTDSTAPTYDPTVGNTTTDGTAVFTARNAWLRYARGQAISDFEVQLTALPDPRATDATWYELGGLFVRSGPLQDYPKFLIRSWDPGTLTATLFLPVSTTDLPANTQFEIHAGCNLTPEQCFSRFNNIVNIRAEYFVPPPSLAASFA